MAAAFVGNITLVAATATRLSDALVAAGYTGPMLGAFLQLDDLALADLRMGHSSAVSGTVGTPISGVNAGVLTRQAQNPRLPVDPSRIWLFSTAGGAMTAVFETF